MMGLARMVGATRQGPVICRESPDSGFMAKSSRWSIEQDMPRRRLKSDIGYPLERFSWQVDRRCPFPD